MGNEIMRSKARKMKAELEAELLDAGITSSERAKLEGLLSSVKAFCLEMNIDIEDESTR